MGCGASLPVSVPAPAIRRDYAKSEGCDTAEARLYELAVNDSSHDGSLTTERGSISRWVLERVTTVKGRFLFDTSKDLDDDQLQAQSAAIAAAVPPATTKNVATWVLRVAEALRTEEPHPFATSADAELQSNQSSVASAGHLGQKVSVALSSRSGVDSAGAIELLLISPGGVAASDTESLNRASTFVSSTPLSRLPSSHKVMTARGPRLTTDIMAQHNALMERSKDPHGDMPYDPSLLVDC